MKAIIAFLAMTAAAQAEPITNLPCAPHDTLARFLIEQFGESVQEQGITEKGDMMQLWANQKTNSWTFMLTGPSGMACLMSSGGSLLVNGEPA